MPSFSDFAGFEGFCFCGGRVNRIVARPHRGIRPPPHLRTSRWSLNYNRPLKSLADLIERSAMKRPVLALAIAGTFVFRSLTVAQFATSIVAYDHGIGFAANFTNANAALGGPTTGASITPYAPPFSTTQIVSIGAGGFLTLQFSTPILNDPANPFGLDLLIFGNSFFVTTNGTGASARTSGAIFTSSVSTRVEVSSDGLSWYTLDPTLAPTVGTLFPTDGIGNPQLPVNPALTNSDFAGLNLAGVRSVYAGSAGGAGYDLGWARDANGDPASLASATFVRIDVLGGRTQIDGIAVVPEPGSSVLVGLAALLTWMRIRRG